ncbi:NUDIX domain-containing protein [Homoserinibacter sp. YIM 151385]|uniref:NUDIX domain-containing protein n=1 Tax=Homoserinibacter sp. YIM 151385 TaxID=2985506 RepID=UPI0022F08FEE|nr:NUDIX domain-containing protein [Homoserinibacter sp. YIM 151385]WBU38766.1 NUDIX domain-containing protein [Homoserinibacter sp. YIM 151385]
MSRASHDPSARRPLGSGDEWVEGARGRFWGRYGAAGLLILEDGDALLQLRVGWSHFGGTWGLPGGARKSGESAASAAIREADEEAGVPPELVEVLGEHVLDLGYWSYTTVIARARERFEPFLGDAESVALEWVPCAQVPARELHPGLAAAWPELELRAGELGGLGLGLGGE